MEDFVIRKLGLRSIFSDTEFKLRIFFTTIERNRKVPMSMFFHDLEDLQRE